MRAAPRTEPLPRCPLCAAEGGRTVLELPDRLHAVPGVFSYTGCASCGTVYQNPRVLISDLSLCYPAEYFPHAERLDAGTREMPPGRRFSGLRDRFRDAVRAVMAGEGRGGPVDVMAGLAHRLRWFRVRAHYGLAIDELLPRVPAPRRALEIGCGAGYLMRTLSRLGWQVDGVEWDEEAVAVARRVSGCQVWVGDFRTVPLAKGHYDLVVLNHVYEHLPDPGNALEHLGSLLTPRGRLVLIYPNPGSLGARVFGAHWFCWDPPRHLALPPPRAVVERARPEGLERRSLRTVATHAPWFLACSQAYRDGRVVDLAQPPTRWWHHPLVVAEALLSAMGVLIGEEAVVVLGRRQEHAANR